MRSYWLAAAVVAGIAGATPAAAQRVWQDGRWVVMPRHSAPHVMRTDRHRWQMVDGRWEAGFRAPGGWNAYRRLHRGGTLPGFWREQDFRIADYLSFGLAAPPHGYGWVRYYDDAVLVDQDGRVWDSIDGIAWGAAAARAGAGFARAESHAGVGAPYAAPRIEPVDPDDYYYDDGPQPHFDAPPPPPPYAEPAPYHGPYPGGYAPPVAPPPVVQLAPPRCAQLCPGGWQGGYGGMTWQNGAWVGSYGAGTTVVVVPGATTTTTTVTEYVERVATRSWRRPTKRLVRKTRPRCGC